MLRRMTLLALAVALVAAAGPARADDEVSINGSGGRIGGAVERTTSTPGSSAGTPAASPTSSGGGQATPGPIITRNRRGITYDYSNVGGGKMRYTFDENRDYCRSSVAFVECFGPRPDRPRGGGGGEPAPPPISPQEIVEQTIVNVRLPQPQPNVDPGYAVTGLKAYLETGNRTSHTFDPIDTVLGPLRISATSSYTVNWGDGSVTGPYDTNGGKYPDGTITHVYQDAETVDITVTQNWTAQWSLAGQSGTIGGLQSSGELPGFEVREVQAVRRR